MGLLESEFIKSISLVKKLLNVLGIPIYMKSDNVTNLERGLRTFHFTVLVTFQLIVLLSLLGYIVAADSFNFLDVTEVLPCSCFCLINFVKLLALRSKLDAVGKLVNELHRLFPTDDENKEIVEIVKHYTRQVKISVMTIFIMNIILVWNWNLSSIISMGMEYFRGETVHKLLPFFMWVPFETDSVFNYVVAYIFHVMAGNFTGLGAVGPDVFFVAMANHIVLQFKLLQIKMKASVDNILPQENQENLDINHDYHEKMYRKMVDCVKIHKDLIELAETVEDIFTLSILINFLCSSVLICCVGFQLTVITGIRGLIFILFLITGLTQTLFVCHAGQTMIDESNAIGDAIYNSKWYLTDKKYRKMAFFIIIRAQRPQVFTALRFSVVCFRSFASIMSSSYSYFTLLNTSYKK